MKLKWFSYLLVVCLLFAAGTVFAVDKVEVTFKYTPLGNPDQVNIAGDFNDWSTTETPMKDKDGDGVYTATLKLKPGNYSYKYVLNRSRWIKPPQAGRYESGGFGPRSGVIRVTQQGVTDPSIAGDGQIAVGDLNHNSAKLNYINLMTKQQLKVKFKTRQGDVQEVILHYKAGAKEQVKLTQYSSDRRFDYYQGTINIDQSKLNYCFEIKDGAQTVWYGANGAVNNRSNLKLITCNTQEKKRFTTPEWVQDAVFYQIFLDRFYNGDSSNDPDSAVIPDWQQGVPRSKSHTITDRDKFLIDNNQIKPNYGYHVFYGGDLQGLEEKITYLKKLGINAVCLNPVFTAASNHKYNTAGYKLVEDNFAVKGNQQASQQYLENLIGKLHQNGIKVILDITFNYTGYQHWAFQDVVKKGKQSQYSDWYFIEDYPVVKLQEQGSNQRPNYKCWWGRGSYPKLNVKNPEVKKYLFSATRRWMDPDGDGNPADGVDGWRVYAPQGVKEINSDFWKEWRKYVKNINPQAYITGAAKNERSQFLQSGEFDGLINYKFRKAVIDFIAQQEINASDFAARLAEMKFNYPDSANYAIQNLIGSHQTKRFLTAANGSKRRLQLASFLQFTYLGSPLIYYGDEVGMAGGSPPDSRRTMVWKDRGYTSPDQQLVEHYQKLIEIRQQEPALRRGNLEQIKVESEMVYAFKRSYQGENLLVLINGGTEEAELAVPVDVSSGRYDELYSGRQVKVAVGKLRMNLGPLSGAIIKLK